MRSFGSDNYSGVHPDVLTAICKANTDHAPAYGQDPWTKQAEEAFAREFGPQAKAFLVFNGTGANVLSLLAVSRRHHSIVCADTAHINTDECSAPEAVTGQKLVPVPTAGGKLTPAAVEPYLKNSLAPHRTDPGVLSITQPTELGTLYSPKEVRELADMAHNYGVKVHMDGARLANAAAALNMGLAELSVDLGVDVLALGGTKNGLMGAEAVVLLNPAHSSPDDFPFLRKRGMQLASKMRYLSAQFCAYFKDELWRKNAAAANAMAQRLARGAAAVPGVSLARPVQANAVFARLPRQAIAPLQQHTPFYVWDQEHDEVRWVTSFDTTADDVDSFLAALQQYSQRL